MVIISCTSSIIAKSMFLPSLFLVLSDNLKIFELLVLLITTLGITKKQSYLEEQVEKAKTSKAERIFILSKDFNIKQNSVQAWLNREDYTYEAKFDIEDFRGSYCLGAVDLAETTDLTSAKILLMKPGDKTKYIYGKYFIPEGKLKKSDDKNAVF